MDKAVGILSLLAEDGPATLAGVVRGTGLARPTAYRLLSALESHGLVAREDLATVPPHVEYRLTTLGKSLSTALSGLDRWAERNFPRLDAARERHLAMRGRGGRANTR